MMAPNEETTMSQMTADLKTEIDKGLSQIRTLRDEVRQCNYPPIPRHQASTSTMLCRPVMRCSGRASTCRSTIRSTCSSSAYALRTAFGGGFDVQHVYELSGPQLYSGDELHPTIRLGTFKLYQGQDRIDPVEVTITRNVAAVPDPTEWTLLIGGFGVVGAALRTRRASASRR